MLGLDINKGIVKPPERVNAAGRRRGLIMGIPFACWPISARAAATAMARRAKSMTDTAMPPGIAGVLDGARTAA